MPLDAIQGEIPEDAHLQMITVLQSGESLSLRPPLPMSGIREIMLFGGELSEDNASSSHPGYITVKFYNDWRFEITGGTIASMWVACEDDTLNTANTNVHEGCHTLPNFQRYMQDRQRRADDRNMERWTRAFDSIGPISAEVIQEAAARHHAAERERRERADHFANLTPSMEQERTPLVDWTDRIFAHTTTATVAPGPSMVRAIMDASAMVTDAQARAGWIDYEAEAVYEFEEV